jgi:hypothetical protein
MELEEIKQLNLFDIIEHYFGGEYIKKKSSKYGRFYNTIYGKLWVRFDYSTGKYFYINLSNDSDKGTLIDFIQNNILQEKNLGKVKKYIKENIRQ